MSFRKSCFRAGDSLLTERGLILKKGAIVDYMLIAAPSFTKSRERNRIRRLIRSIKAIHGILDTRRTLVRTRTPCANDRCECTWCNNGIEAAYGRGCIVYDNSVSSVRMSGKTRLHGISKVGKSGIVPTVIRPKARMTLFVCRGKSGRRKYNNHLSCQGGTHLHSKAFIPLPKDDTEECETVSGWRERCLPGWSCLPQADFWAALDGSSCDCSLPLFSAWWRCDLKEL